MPKSYFISPSWYKRSEQELTMGSVSTKRTFTGSASYWPSLKTDFPSTTRDQGQGEILLSQERMSSAKAWVEVLSTLKIGGSASHAKSTTVKLSFSKLDFVEIPRTFEYTNHFDQLVKLSTLKDGTKNETMVEAMKLGRARGSREPLYIVTGLCYATDLKVEVEEQSSRSVGGNIQGKEPKSQVGGGGEAQRASTSRHYIHSQPSGEVLMGFRVHKIEAKFRSDNTMTTLEEDKPGQMMNDDEEGDSDEDDELSFDWEESVDGAFGEL